MKHKKIYAIIEAAIEAVILAVVALLSFTVLNTEYLFQWAAHNWKFYFVLGAIALLPVFFHKQFLSAFMTAGIVIGIFAGNYLGGLINRYNESKIVEGMKAEELYKLRHHPGFEIWMGIILLSIVSGFIIQAIVKKRRRKG